ncbi:MAG: 2-hydroxychromene-2-carboxylate isomerase [Ectothiorhodospiraceae bacterium]
MQPVIDHFFSVLSPWAFLGWPEINRIAGQHGARLRNLPVDLPRVFQANGGIPGPKKSPAKQRYRDEELRRWGAFRGIDINPRPSHHPFDANLATRLIVAAEQDDEPASQLTYRLMQALWLEDRNLADAQALAELAREAGFDADALFAAADARETVDRVETNTQEAIDRGVFGVPTYFLGESMFWGQDRLDFVERGLMGP